MKAMAAGWTQWCDSPPVVVCAIGSRMIAVTLAAIADGVLPDHEPDGVLEFTFPHGCMASDRLRSFTRWDSAHFLSVAADGWEHEYSHAFFPLYPLLVRGVASLLSRVLPLCSTELHVLAALLLSNSMFVVAACCLHGLSECVLRDWRLARTAALLFCVSPASVLFSTAYTEFTFAATTFGGMLLLEGGRPWLAAGALSLASASRANGLLHAVYVAWAGVRHLGPRLLERPAAPRFLPWRWAAAAAVGGTLLRVLVVLAPYAAWQAVGYRRVCEQSMPSLPPTSLSPTRIRHAEGRSTVPSDWCRQGLPDLYVHVQRSYWGVRLFGYFEWRQLPNFLLAAPALALCAAASVTSVAVALERCRGQSTRTVLARAIGLRVLGHGEGRGGGEGACAGDSSKPSTADGATTPRALVYVLHWSLLSGLTLLMGNVQVVTRLVAAACPPFYWYMAHLALLRGQSAIRGRAAGDWLGSLKLRRALCTYIAVFVSVGTVLHANHFPWT